MPNSSSFLCLGRVLYQQYITPILSSRHLVDEATDRF